MNFDPKFLRWAVLNQVPLATAIMAIMVAVTLAATQLIPATYTATARLLVEATSVSHDTRAPSDTLTDAAHLQNIENRIMTQSRLTTIIAGLGTDLSVEDMRNAAYFDPVSGRGKATTLGISFGAKDPLFATTVTNLLADEVVKEHRAIRTERAEEALAFFRQEVTDSRRRLDTKLSDLLGFKAANAGALPTDLPRLMEQRKTVSAQLTTAPTQLAMSSSHTRLISELHAARAIYSTQHPKVQMLLTKINQLDQAPIITPVSTTILPTALAEIDSALAAIPANELQLQALQRDHDLSEAQYKAAVSRLEAAAIEERIALRKNGDRLSIIERAQLPDLPAGPKQRLILAFGLVLSVLTALAIAIMRARTDPIIRRPFDLETGLGLRAYAVIPQMKPLDARP